MVSAFFTLPLVYLSYSLESRIDLRTTIIETIIQLFGMVLFFAIVLYLKRLLNTLFNFHNTDRNIDLMIIANFVTGVLSIAALYFTSLKESIISVVIVVLVIQGIVQIQLGYKLFKLPYDFGGMLKPFCYANIVTGILLASIIMIPLGIVASAISDLMLGTIFFNMSKRVKEDKLLIGV